MIIFYIPSGVIKIICKICQESHEKFLGKLASLFVCLKLAAKNIIKTNKSHHLQIFISPFALPNPMPQSDPQLFSRPPAVVFVPTLLLSPMDSTDHSFLTSIPTTHCFIPRLQLQLALSGNSQATLTREASRLTADLRLLLLFSKYNSPVLFLALQQNTC